MSAIERRQPDGDSTCHLLHGDNPAHSNSANPYVNQVLPVPEPSYCFYPEDSGATHKLDGRGTVGRRRPMAVLPLAVGRADKAVRQSKQCTKTVFLSIPHHES